MCSSDLEQAVAFDRAGQAPAGGARCVEAEEARIIFRVADQHQRAIEAMLCCRVERLRHEAAADAIALLNEWGGKPLPLSASAWLGGQLNVRLSGARAAVDAAIAQLGGERLDDNAAATFWQGIREQRDDFFTSAAPLWRLSVKSSTPPLNLAGSQLIEWGGSQRWIVTDADPATVREAARYGGGHATLFRGGDKSDGVFHPLPARSEEHTSELQSH